MSARPRAILTALAAFVALSLFAFYFLHLPGAARIDEDKEPAAHSDETLTLSGVQDQPAQGRSAPVRLLAIKAAAGMSAAVDADMATLDDASRKGLTELHQQVPTAPGPIQWSDPGNGGGAAITLTLAPSDRSADVEVTRDDDPQSIGLTFTPHGAALMVSAVVPLTQTQGDTILHLGKSTITQSGAGALPLTFVVADNQAVSVRLPIAGQADARFALGDARGRRGRPLTLAGLSIADDNGVRAAYCGAKPGAVLWQTHNLANIRCEPMLHASRLIVADTIGLDLSGSAFQGENGITAPSPVITEITGNPEIAAILGLCYGGVATWLFAALFKTREDSRTIAKRRSPRRALPPPPGPAD